MKKTVTRVSPLEPAKALKDSVRELLAENGPLAEVRKRAGLPFACNPQQAELALAYADIIGATDPELHAGGRVAAVSAETGMGKTAAYLAPLTLNAAMLGHQGEVGEKGMISTRTRALQRQLVNPAAQADETRLIAEAAALLHPENPRVRFAPRFGRRNYVDKERARTAANNADADLAGLLNAIADADAATFDELSDCFPPDELRRVSPDDLCVTVAASPEASGKYREDAERAKNADIVVVNHALALLDARLGGKLFPQRQIAVFDEADTLPDQARAMADERVALETVRLSLSALPPSDAAVKAAQSAAERLKRAAYDALKNGALVAKPQNGELIESVMEFCQTLRAAEKSPDAKSILNDDDDLRATLRAAAVSLERWGENAEAPGRGVDSVITPAPGRDFPAFHLRNRSPAFVLSRLWKAPDDGPPLYRAVVFTSATLSPFRGLGDAPEDPRPFMREMGIGAGAGKDRRSSVNPDHCRAFAPEQFGEMEFILAAESAPSARTADNHPEFPPYAAAAIRKASENDSRVLVLTPSFDFAETLGAALNANGAKKNDFALLVHRRGESLPALLEKYKAAKSGAVLMTPSAWEGADLPGLVDHLVIPRIPFAPQDESAEAVMRDRMAKPENAGGVNFARNSAAAARKLKQGLGRGIRKADDRCVVWILDKRFPAPFRGRFPGNFSAMPALVIPARFRDFDDSAFENARAFHADGRIAGR